MNSHLPRQYKISEKEENAKTLFKNALKNKYTKRIQMLENRKTTLPQSFYGATCGRVASLMIQKYYY
jgi:hypothetical protein